MSTSGDWLAVTLMMAAASRQALETPGAALYALYGTQPLPGGTSPGPARAAVPEEALQPWPQRPERDACDAQPARWAELRKVRDPQPELFEGLTGMASWHRAAGWPVERALRESPADCFWYDPELPLSLIMGGFPIWNREGQRPDTGESAEDFAGLVLDYEREMAAGSVFPPLLVTAIEPEYDRPAVGLRRWIESADCWWTQRPHYQISAGRHRAAAAWRSGMRTFGAFVTGPGRELLAAHVAYGDHCFLAAAEAAREHGRTGLPRDWLAETGPVRIDPGAG